MAAKAALIEKGIRFGRLTVTGPAQRQGHCLYLPVCCDCGVEKLIEQTSLRKGRSQSCGCLNSELARQRSLTHGMRGKPVYAVWNVMLQRCHNPRNKQYPDYGGRGIDVVKSWHLFENFLRDMGEPPFAGATLERKHNDKGYSKSNCAWATRTEQVRNRRNTVNVSWKGTLIPLADLLDQLGRGAEYSKIYQRVFTYRWPVEKAIETP